MPILTPEDIRGSLPYATVTDDQARLAIARTRGWISEATGLEPLPEDLPEALWADGLDLAILVATNPELLSQRSAGPTSRSWPIGDQRNAILERVRTRYGKAKTTPRGSYPEPQPWPDEARPSSQFWVGWT